jgi:hypothetical protein
VEKCQAVIEEIRYYSGMFRGIYRYQRQPAAADPLAALREQMAAREARFLDCARRIVFANPANPYHTLFRLAQCDYADLAAEVQRHGLEPTLERLLSAGVYLTHDEFKGKAPIVRAGLEIPSMPRAYLNPLARGEMESRSSGSRGPATPSRHSTESQHYRMAYSELETRDLGLDAGERGLVYPVLPSAIGLNQSLRLGHAGQPVRKWFAPQGRMSDSGHYRAMTNVLVRYGRALGVPLPLPEALPEDDFAPVARWLAEEKRRGRRASITGFVSPAVRVATAARETGLDIGGTVIIVGGEALTDAKRAVIEAAGCTVYPTYVIHEVGRIGCACSRMRSGNRVHLFSDGVAVISRRRLAPLSDVEVNSLLFTTLLPFGTYFLINAEMDDAGVVEPIDCDCEYAKLGMNVQISDIFSYGKLTGQGVTLMGSDVLRVLEVALPARFGGVAGDFQLVEVDGARQAGLTLRVSPRVGAAAPDAVRDFFLDEIRRFYGGALAARLWKHSQALRVVVEEPLATHSGKVLPLHILGSNSGQITHAA